jgi:hypothetical protein
MDAISAPVVENTSANSSGTLVAYNCRRNGCFAIGMSSRCSKN